MPLTGFETVTCVLVTPAKLLYLGEGVLLFGWKLYSLFFSLYWWLTVKDLGLQQLFFLTFFDFYMYLPGCLIGHPFSFYAWARLRKCLGQESLPYM
jgi:hypothetical protein